MIKHKSILLCLVVGCFLSLSFGNRGVASVNATASNDSMIEGDAVTRFATCNAQLECRDGLVIMCTVTGNAEFPIVKCPQGANYVYCFNRNNDGLIGQSVTQACPNPTPTPSNSPSRTPE